MSGRTRFPFTPSQWQELEHQALIYKYMVSGISIPPDLLFSIKRSCLDSPLPSKLFSHHPPHIGWSCFQMGLGRKIDPEPGRCRRTDGKKWRCSKEAFADSKYCERHMHRGKNRSRKPVEVFKTPITTNSNPSSSSTPTTISSITSKNNPPSTSTPTFHSLSSSLSSLSSESHHNQLNHSSYNTNLDYHLSSIITHLLQGLLDLVCHIKKEILPCFWTLVLIPKPTQNTEPSGSVRDFSGSSSMDDSWQFTPLTMSTCTSSSSKQRSCSALQSEHSHSQLQSNITPKQQNYYALGSDMKMDRNEGTQKTIHRFFDEWPLKDKDSWLDLDDKSSNSGSVSNTRLSISTHDFPIFSSRNHNDD
ncbi:growth-regulating factor 1 isoform X2 [Prunus yedoensis var. nudiflora]|uniref:Growth-regulating factor n=1 Tax=Prunus yedoensis var. nudiflora TaxID=2094558 RepID=A0A314YHP7_PRUYE|nr:growth-regulating factor 1 isoform X2 [Prunus yedoensis var. nudiflora]